MLKPLSHLFTSVPDPVPLAACPDVAWPDAFNSGMLVAKPSDETFKGLCELMVESGSWDGGDQGLLNDFFPNWHRLPFIYNVTPTAYYTCVLGSPASWMGRLPRVVGAPPAS